MDCRIYSVKQSTGLIFVLLFVCLPPGLARCGCTRDGETERSVEEPVGREANPKRVSSFEGWGLR